MAVSHKYRAHTSSMQVALCPSPSPPSLKKMDSRDSLFNFRRTELTGRSIVAYHHVHYAIFTYAVECARETHRGSIPSRRVRPHLSFSGISAL